MAEIYPPTPAGIADKGAMTPVTAIPAAGSIGATGFEPATSPTRTVRATRLRHAPRRRIISGVDSAGGRDRRLDVLFGRRALENLLRHARPGDRHRWRVERQVEAVGELGILGDSRVRCLGAEVLVPFVLLELGQRKRHIVEERLRHAARADLVLIAEEEVDVLPFAVLGGGRDGGTGGERRLRAAEGEVAKLELDRVPARVLVDQAVDRADLVVGAGGALEVVEDGDRDRGVGVAETPAVLANPA